MTTSNQAMNESYDGIKFFANHFLLGGSIMELILLKPTIYDFDIR